MTFGHELSDLIFQLIENLLIRINLHILHQLQVQHNLDKRPEIACILDLLNNDPRLEKCHTVKAKITQLSKACTTL